MDEIRTFHNRLTYGLGEIERFLWNEGNLRDHLFWYQTTEHLTYFIKSVNIWNLNIILRKIKNMKNSRLVAAHCR